MPEIKVKVRKGKITELTVVRGAPCGATWRAIAGVLNMPPDEAAVRIGLEAQFFCIADPAGWDPISGKSRVHLAGEFHHAALLKALEDF